jgi:NAD(P)H-hydrate epimerase
MARLCGVSVDAVQAARLGVARTFSMQRQVTLVLKGARTVVSAEDGTAYVNPTGNAGMASAGMGDVLAGLIGALLAQGLNPLGAATTGVYAHGLAADLAVERTGRLGLVAGDVIEALPEVWRRWKR